VPRQVWKKKWVAHCQAAGSGRQVLNYLGRYIFRVAISNSPLERIENGEVQFNPGLLSRLADSRDNNP
jgi:hypothetical protein